MLAGVTMSSVISPSVTWTQSRRSNVAGTRCVTVTAGVQVGSAAFKRIKDNTKCAAVAATVMPHPLHK